MTATAWGLGSVLRLHISTDHAEAFEADVRRQVAEVEEHEPGTLLYGFYREDEADDRVTYLHTMAYRDQDAQEAHWARESVWWWDAFRAYLQAPIESERFTGEALLRAWSSTAAIDGALVVAIVDPCIVEALDLRSSSIYGWALRVVTADDPSVLHVRSPGVLVVSATTDADQARALAGKLHVAGGNFRIGGRKIAGLVRTASNTDLEQET